MVEQKFIKVGEEGRLIPVEDCYSFIYECGDGRTVLRAKITDTNISVLEVLELFNNEANEVIREYKEIKPVPQMPGNNIPPVEDGGSVATSTDHAKYELVSTHEDFCKEMSYEYSKGVFSIEIIKKTKEEKLAEIGNMSSEDTMAAILDLYNI